MAVSEQEQPVNQVVENQDQDSSQVISSSESEEQNSNSQTNNTPYLDDEPQESVTENTQTDENGVEGNTVITEDTINDEDKMALGEKESAEARRLKERFKNVKSLFKLDLRPQIVELPELKDPTTMNVHYPLIPPHTNAHVFWDQKHNELVYYIEEPILSDVEKEILRLLKLGLEEMINISFINATRNNVVLLYLEQNVQSILAELGTKVSMETYQKLMYFIYRDFIGINEIEPLMRDYFIEDIECNGVGAPIYIVHRKYRNLKTNLTFSNNEQLTSFVEKLAQKSGRYVSYAQPLLDGTLPDGSRVNATYSSDVTTRGPTFTVRKFTKDPWTPTHLIKMGTASAEVFAYCWLAIEHKFNLITIGETGSGKTTFLNSVVSFIPSEARVCSIEDTRELNLAHENWLPSVTRAGFGVSQEKYGEVTLFDLLRESFRQNPDYVIVGEVRDKETYVLFQGMASGHSSFSTFHAASVDALVRRLETPPISLPASLIESLNIICVISHIKDQEKNIRRLKELNEIISVKQELGKVEYNSLFTYDPVKDTNSVKSSSYILKLINKITGTAVNELEVEVQLRAELLKKLVEKNIVDFREFGEIINSYYKNSEKVLGEHGVDISEVKKHVTLKASNIKIEDRTNNGEIDTSNERKKKPGQQEKDDKEESEGLRL
jgi:flagellar protein FlaI